MYIKWSKCVENCSRQCTQGKTPHRWLWRKVRRPRTCTTLIAGCNWRLKSIIGCSADWKEWDIPLKIWLGLRASSMDASTEHWSNFGMPCLSNHRLNWEAKYNIWTLGPTTPYDIIRNSLQCVHSPLSAYSFPFGKSNWQAGIPADSSNGEDTTLSSCDTSLQCT